MDIRRHAGAGFASKSVVALSVLLPLLVACVVLNPNEFERTNSPPSLRSPDDARLRNLSIDQIVTLDLTLGANELVLPIIVGDADRDAVTARVFVDYDFATKSAVFSGQLPVVAFEQETNEAIQFVRVPTLSVFTAGTCHRVELLASSGFQNSGADGSVDIDRTPIRPNDLTRVIWWVQIIDALNPSVSMAACP